MEKRRPHYPLERVKGLVLEGAYRVTDTARQSAVNDFGLSKLDQIAACILDLDPVCFYKSMSTHRDPRLWQDVYRPEIQGVLAYVKIQIADNDTVVISFKRL
ncbi:MAG: type II toxin-antitoxin system MqsR family toxin [Candidatus Hydrogenedentes bacterium]|nr:type II toxin-antitoxin system MqsR family toxin [Candidatus Hydrogenedentota bacterium]MBI3117790.1 type II toxin-antitoxin system MqsR family toxin [Candidatus Hydrogenedentota bacterium]